MILHTGETGESQYGSNTTQTQIAQLRQENEKLIAKVDKLSKALEASLHQKQQHLYAMNNPYSQVVSAPQTPSTEVSNLPQIVKKPKDKEVQSLQYQLCQQEKTI